MNIIDRVLVADDEFLVREFMEEAVRRCGVEVITAANGNEAIEMLKKNDVQMAFVDMQMGETTGMDVLKYRNEHCPDVILVIITAYGSIETAVEAMKLGAFDFLIKPFTPDQAAVIIEKARKWLQLTARKDYFESETQGNESDKKIVGESPEIKQVLKLVERVAPAQATALITGESGTGKELIAGETHRLSDPKGIRPYIRMNCAAVPETLLESELFGHEKGSFTGANERRIGRFELADGGTLLLDEIGEISPEMQAKLLRVLQESEFERVGGSKTIKVDVRVIATTNRDLKREVKEGNFREDLYYRLNVFPIHLPPLRERREDCVKIAKVLLQKQEVKLRRKLEFSKEALGYIHDYPWPGNIRELQNVVERVAILEDGPLISGEALPDDIRCPDLDQDSPATTSTAPASLNLKELEEQTIKQALEKTSGNRTHAAKVLGISVRTLRNKLNDYQQDALLEQTTDTTE